MIQIEDFKVVKDKKIRFLYETISEHLNYVFNTDDMELLNSYIKRVLAYLNGYTEKDKLFSHLRKTNFDHPYLFLQWLIEYAKFKIEYIKQPKIKRFDDLLLYSNNQSPYGFLFLITDNLAARHINIISNIAKIDILTYILKHDNALKLSGKIHYPLQLIEDYGLDYSFENTYMKNEAYTALFEMIHFKIEGYIKTLTASLDYFKDHESLVIKNFINVRKDYLQSQRKSLIDHLNKEKNHK